MPPFTSPTLFGSPQSRRALTAPAGYNTIDPQGSTGPGRSHYACQAPRDIREGRSPRILWVSQNASTSVAWFCALLCHSAISCGGIAIRDLGNLWLCSCHLGFYKRLGAPHLPPARGSGLLQRPWLFATWQISFNFSVLKWYLNTTTVQHGLDR